MYELDIVDYGLEFDGLTRRSVTDGIVLHNTGAETDTDTDAESIHDYHLSIGWVGIGYHYVIRKDGTIEKGRPEWAVGSHCYGENNHTIGIHLSGNFNIAEPTAAQVESCALLIAHLCKKYDFPPDREHVFGHRELNDDTDCPGDNLQALLDDGTITGKAAWYQENPKGDEEA